MEIRIGEPIFSTISILTQIIVRGVAKNIRKSKGIGNKRFYVTWRILVCQLEFCMPTAQREAARAAGPTPCLIAYSDKLFALFSNENHFGDV